MLRCSISLLLLCLLAACSSPTYSTLSEQAGTPYGAPIPGERVLPAEQLLVAYRESELLDTVSTTLRGTVNEVCQKKGCWMTMDGGESGQMMVRFKDYGFFVPKDIGGREVVVHGKAYYQLTPVEELRHYAEDAGQSPEEIATITEPRRELHFLAEGVRVL
jgi:hypothetical protein